VESSNGRLRENCLNAHWLSSLANARDKIEAKPVPDNVN